MFPLFVCVFLQHCSNSDTSHLGLQLLIKLGILQYTRSNMQGDNKKCVVFFVFKPHFALGIFTFTGKISSKIIYTIK